MSPADRDWRADRRVFARLPPEGQPCCVPSGGRERAARGGQQRSPPADHMAAQSEHDDSGQASGGGTPILSTPPGTASPRRARNQRWLRSGRGVFRPCPGCEVGENPGLGGMGAGGAVMRAVIVYESMFGSTKKVAEAIAEGLADCAEVSVVPVTSADAHILDGADLVVVGGPTHTHGMSRPGTRKMAGKLARKPGSEVELAPGASAARECANGSHRSAGWRSPAPLSIPGSRDCRRSLAGRRSPSADSSPTTGRASRRHPRASSSRA